jgi:hypothetical protein
VFDFGTRADSVRTDQNLATYIWRGMCRSARAPKLIATERRRSRR